MSERQLPVRPNLDQLKHQARDLQREMRVSDPAVRLARAQHTLAKSYGLPNWPRLVQACRVVDAIWEDDPGALRRLILKRPALLHEMARGTQKCNWGPPMSYAANLGRNGIIEMLRALGASDVQHAFDRACLQGRLDTARRLFDMGARPTHDTVMWTAETQNSSGMRFLLDLGVEIADAGGNRMAPVGMLLQTYCRNMEQKHQCLEMLAANGREFPDTPAMAIHRGRLDMLEPHVRRDPGLLSRRFSHPELFPPAAGCSLHPDDALCGAPVIGGTLLHLCVDTDQIEIARWLIENGANVNTPSAVDVDGFGGYPALFCCVVSQTYCSGRRRDDVFARLLLDNGADKSVRASMRKQLRGARDERLYEYRDLTASELGRTFHDRAFVNPAVMRLLDQKIE